jgi:hypothetical protein
VIDTIDPREAVTIVDVIADDLPRPAAAMARQRVVVRLLKQARRDRRELAPDVRVRSIAGDQPLRARTFAPRRPVREFVIYASTYLVYDSRRIVADLRGKYSVGVVRQSSIRALMYSVRLPDVHEATEFEEEA